MADTIIAARLQLDGAEANRSVGNFKTQLRQANQELIQMQAEFGEVSPQAIAAARSVAALRDNINDAREVAALFDPGARFQALGNVVRTVAGGFSALTGALALFGEQSEEVEKTLLKVQSALAISEGLNTIFDAAPQFARLKVVAVDAFKAIKVAIGSTGIGLIVVAIGTLVAYWDDIKEAVSGVSEEQKELTKASKENAEAEQNKLKAIDSQDNILKLQGKTEEQILAIKIRQTDEVIKATEEQLISQQELLKAQVKAEERNKAILKGILDFSAGGINIILKGIDLIGKAFGKQFDLSGKLNNYLSDLIFDPAATKKKGDEEIAVIQGTIDDLKNRRAGYLLSLQVSNKEANKKLQDLRNENSINAIRDAYEQQAARIRIEYETGVKEVEAMKASGAAKRAIIKELGIKEQQALAEVRKTRDEAVQKSIDDINLKIAKIQEDDKKAQEDIFDRNIANEIASSELRKKDLQAVVDNQKAQTEAVRLESAQRLDFISSSLSKASDIVGQYTIAGKVLAIASATIDTYRAIAGQLSAFSKIPIPGYAIAQAIVTGIFGFAQVAKIIKTPVPGKSSGAGSVGSAGIPSISASAPLSPQAIVGNTQLPQGQINQIGNASIRAFVVESDITSNQERVRRLSRAARLGG